MNYQAIKINKFVHIVSNIYGENNGLKAYSNR